MKRRRLGILCHVAGPGAPRRTSLTPGPESTESCSDRTHVFRRDETLPPDLAAWARQATGWLIQEEHDHADPCLEEEPVG